LPVLFPATVMVRIALCQYYYLLGSFRVLVPPPLLQHEVFTSQFMQPDLRRHFESILQLTTSIH